MKVLLDSVKIGVNPNQFEQYGTAMCLLDTCIFRFSLPSCLSQCFYLHKVGNESTNQCAYNCTCNRRPKLCFLRKHRQK